MDKKVKSVYLSGIENDEFLIDFNEADGDKKPPIFASEMEKHLFAAAYYGWLIGKYGKDWEEYI